MGCSVISCEICLTDSSIIFVPVFEHPDFFLVLLERRSVKQSFTPYVFLIQSKIGSKVHYTGGSHVL